MTSCPMCLGVKSTHGTVPRTAFNLTSTNPDCLLCAEYSVVLAEVGAAWRIGGMTAAAEVSALIADRVQRRAWKWYEHKDNRLPPQTERDVVCAAADQTFASWRESHDRNEKRRRLALGHK